MKSGESRAQANRRFRQEALREQLSKQGHVQQAVEIINKLKDFEDEPVALDALQVTRLSKALEGHMKLVNKYLPDQKEVFNELTGEDGGPVKLQEIIFNPVSNGTD